MGHAPHADTTCLAVDLGTTWAKLAVYACRDGEPELLHSVRLESGAGWYDGSADATAHLLAFSDELLRLIRDSLAAYPADRLGLTGIREGLVLLDEAGGVLWASGNALLDTELMLDCPISGIDIGGFIPDIVARNPQAHALLSLQGHVAYRLTGRMAITGSELDALGLLRESNRRCGAVQRLLAPVEIVPVGAPLGRVGRTVVYLAGTDEQASHHGAGIGTTADLGLATATFWSLTAPALHAPTDLPQVRFIPAQPPYCATASVIGYRFGPYLQQALEGEVPDFPPRLPRWAVGELLNYLRGTTSVRRERLVDCVVADIRSALGLLARVCDIPAAPTVCVHGGGLSRLRDFTVEVMERLGHAWVGLEGDATQIGCCRAGRAAP
ncbi:MAG: hypothetical protein KKI08_02050 [Armatimonadetes bacterium]|nr:hypothetical protein [Armatimonadota bacterium]